MEAFDKDLIRYLSTPNTLNKDNLITVLFQAEDETALCNMQATVSTDADFDEVTDCERDEYGWHDVSYPELIEDSVDCKIIGLQVMEVVKDYGNFNKETFEKEFKDWINESQQNFQESGEFYEAVIEEIKNNN
jgi:hypothetical protein